MIGKIFWHENKTLKKEKELGEIFQRQESMTKRKNYFYLNERNIKKFNCTEMNCCDQSKKNWIDFLFHCNMKRGQESIPLKHEVVLQWNGALLASFPAQSS